MAVGTQPHCAAVDNTFGPHAGACRGGFDFTLLFEETVLSILPLALTLLAIPLRVTYLLRRDVKVKRSPLLPLKLVVYGIHGLVHIALIVLWTQARAYGTQTSVANAAIALAGSLSLGVLSLVEHQRTVHPSLILNSYLLLSWIFDAARTRTLWLRGYDGITANRDLAAVTTIAFAFKTLLVFLEALGKRRILRKTYSSFSPEAISGTYSRWFFWWLLPLFRKGFRQILSVESLFDIDKHLTSRYLYTLIQPAWARVPSGKAHSLLILVVTKIKWSFLSAVPYRLGLTAFTYCQPFLIEKAIELSGAPISKETTQAGYGLIGAYFLVYGGIAITTSQYQHLTYRSITMARGGLISMLFAKVASLDIRNVDPGSSTTLMSADIERVTTGWATIHDLWACVIEVGLAIYLMELQLGAACGIPIAVAVIALVLAFWVFTLVVKRQALWLEAIERRIESTTNMLGAMKRVKMCGLAETLKTQLQRLRVQELRISKKFRHLLIWSLVLGFTTPIIAPILTFAVFSAIAIASGGTSTLDTGRAFTSYSLFALLADPLTLLISAMTQFAGSIGCFERIRTFLECPEHADHRIKRDATRNAHSTSQNTSNSTLTPDDLAKVSTKQPKLPELLFHSSQNNSESRLSGDASEKTLQVAADEKIGHKAEVNNERWISIENGSFGWDTTKEPLLRSINLVAPGGKLTMVVGAVGCGKSTLLKAMLGEVPVLSGTIQVPDITMAYCDQSTFHMNGTIKDSVMAYSEPDEQWYKTTIKACALDEDLLAMPKGDQTLIGSKGIALSGGQSQRLSLARAVYARQEICILDDVLSGLDLDTENRVFHNLLGANGLLRQSATTVILASSLAKRVPYADHVIVLGKNGIVVEQGSFNEVNACGGYISNLNLRADTAALDFMSQKTSDPASQATALAPPKRSDSAAAIVDDINASNRQSGDISIYLYYVRSVGWPATIIFFVAMSIFAFCYTFPTIWLKWWADANAKAPNSNLGFWLGIYAAIGVVGLAALGISCWQLIVTMVPISGEAFHLKLLSKVLGAPMSFFSTVDAGITLNRFSQDLQLIDMDLPINALNFFATFILCLAQMVILGVSSVYVAVSYPIILAMLYLIQGFYLRTSRQLRFLDIEAKAPLYSQFVESLSGLMTIRAFGWQRKLENKNWRLLDLSQRPFYLMWTVQRWLTVVLDLMVMAIAVILVVLIVELRGILDPGFAGVALVNIVLFSQQLRMLLTFWTQLETHIGAIARVKLFTEETKTEDLPDENGKTPPAWPSSGAIDFQSVSATYDGTHQVLKDVTLSIEPGQKVAVCGRTGSGKTSMVMSVFRMVDYSGSITVDGVDLATIPRRDVRSHIVGLPQDAFLLTGTVRLNADPFARVSDEAIIDALDEVGLWNVIQAKGGLDANVNDIHLSHGQKQLFSLAQALLRPSSILILDEATSR